MYFHFLLVFLKFTRQSKNNNTKETKNTDSIGLFQQKDETDYQDFKNKFMLRFVLMKFVDSKLHGGQGINIFMKKIKSYFFHSPGWEFTNVLKANS